MTKNRQEIIKDPVKCLLCEKEGHKLESALVETNDGYRNLKYCICCGSPLIWRNLDCIEDHRHALDSSSSCLAINKL